MNEIEIGIWDFSDQFTVILAESEALWLDNGTGGINTPWNDSEFWME